MEKMAEIQQAVEDLLKGMSGDRTLINELTSTPVAYAQPNECLAIFKLISAQQEKLIEAYERILKQTTPLIFCLFALVRKMNEYISKLEQALK